MSHGLFYRSGFVEQEWVTLATAPDQIAAEMWRDLLVELGIPSTTDPGDTSRFLGVSPRPCRVRVSRSCLDEAREILDDYLGERFRQK